MASKKGSKYRATRAAAGLCIYCGKNKAVNGPTKRCPVCLVKSREYSQSRRDLLKRLREEWVAAGLCMYCGKRKATHGKRCKKCRDRDNAKHREWLKRATTSRKAAGLCKACGKKPICLRSITRCSDCLTRESSRNGEKQVRQNAYQREYYQRLKLQIIDHYTAGKRVCACCGEADLRFLSIDHCNNDGAAHRKAFGVVGGIPLFRFIIKNNFPPDFQILCYNCNCGKHHNGGVCPHMETKARKEKIRG